MQSQAATLEAGLILGPGCVATGQADCHGWKPKDVRWADLSPTSLAVGSATLLTLCFLPADLLFGGSLAFFQVQEGI